MKSKLAFTLKVTSCLAMMVTSLAYAKEDEPSSAEDISFAKLFKSASIDVSGYLDAGFIGHNQMPDPSVQVFDTSKNSFSLNQASITLSKTPKEGLGWLVDLIVGSNAGYLCSYGACSGNNLNAYNSTMGSGGNFDPTQVYMQYITGPWTLIGGKFNSMSGVEVPNSVADTNITRSILYGHSPFTHTGVRAVNALSDATTLTMGVNNGWDQVTGMTVSKTGEFAINQAFTKDTSLLFDVYDGAESVPTSLGWAGTMPPLDTITNMYSANAGTPYSGVRSGNRLLLDTVFTSNLTPALTFILNADHSSQQNAVIGPLGQVGTEIYWGWAGYLNYQFNEQYRVSFRAEQLHDLSGVAVAAFGTAPGANTVREATLTFGYAPVKDIELRAEVRGDNSDKGIFAASNGVLMQNMVTYGLQGIYKF
jgi:hypothetical protein